MKNKQVKGSGEPSLVLRLKRVFCPEEEKDGSAATLSWGFLRFERHRQRISGEESFNLHWSGEVSAIFH